MKAGRIAVMMSATSFPASRDDWKGVFIRHLAEAMAERTDTSLSLWAPPGDADAAVRRVTTRDDEEWLDSLMARGGIAHLLRRRPWAGVPAGVDIIRRLRRAQLQSDADVFHVNWLQNALALPADSRPALVTVLGSDLKLLDLPGMALLLRRAFRGRRVVLCPNADWMVPVLRARFGDAMDIEAVPFGIDRRWCRLDTPGSTAPEQWLAVTRITRDKLGPLLDWAEPWFDDGQRVLNLLGPLQEQITLPPWVHHPGATNPEALLRDWFPRAQGLISLSRHSEGRPQVILEAMAAGLPVIASRIAAHEDCIASGRTGYLVDSRDELGEALQALAQPGRRGQIAAAARDHVRATVGDWQDCAGRYHGLYRRLLGASTP